MVDAADLVATRGELDPEFHEAAVGWVGRSVAEPRRRPAVGGSEK
jgi:hypothetical protein